MNTTSPVADRSRRLLLATGLVAAPALMALGIGAEPAVPADGATTFEAIAGQSGRYYLAILARIPEISGHITARKSPEWK